MTGTPSPGPLIRAAITAMASAAMVVWLSPTRIVRRAMGSCTLLTICHLLEPIERAASMVVGETLRMPSAVILMATGTA